MNAAILTYHHVAVPESPHNAHLYVSPGDFERQIEFLNNRGFQVVPLDRVREALLNRESLPERTVAISFDDGFEDNYTNAFPILKKYGFPATVFSVAGSIPPEGEPGKDGEGGRYLSAKQLRELSREGVAIGSHAVHHKRLATLPMEEALEEITGSKRILEEICEREIRWFSYPFGSYSRQLADRVREAGYWGAVSVIRDNRLRESQLYWLPRVMVMGDSSLARFRYYFSGLYHWIHHRKNRKRWEGYV